MSGALRVSAAAKVNLALVVGPSRSDGLHELTSVVQRVDLCDRLELTASLRLEVDGFGDDTLVTTALEQLAAAAGVEPAWKAVLRKRIPIATGLGGGSADAAAALRLANRTLLEPLPAARLHELAIAIGSDVPFFLEPGPKLVEGIGERLTPLELPQDYWVLLALAHGSAKASTGSVYARFDALGGGAGFDERRAAIRTIVNRCRRPRELAALPPNDLAEAAGASELPARLASFGAFRADTSGAGPAVYGLFHGRGEAEAAAKKLARLARTWVVAPVW